MKVLDSARWLNLPDYPRRRGTACADPGTRRLKIVSCNWAQDAWIWDMVGLYGRSGIVKVLYSVYEEESSTL